MPTILRILHLLIADLLMTAPVWAQLVSGAAAELVSTRQAKVNGSFAISGATVFSGSRIDTAQQGAAILSLGKLGRLELGAEADLVLHFSEGRLGGELYSGRVVLSAPVGVAVSVFTAKGTITTDGLRSVALTIEGDSERTRIVAHLGEARVLSAVTDKYVREGEEITLNSGGTKSVRAALPTGSQAPTTLAGLIGASIRYWVAGFIGGNELDAGQAFDDTVTCLDQFRNICHRRGAVSP